MRPTIQTTIAALIAIAVLGMPAANAQTPVPAGTISADTTWTLTGSPYEIQGTITIQGTDGADGITTLTIEPGVEVRMASNSFVYVGGTSASFPGALVADGDAAGGPATIRFTADSVTPAPGFWRGVQLRGGADASTLLRNVEIRYAGAFTSPALQVQTGAAISIPIEDVRIHDAAEAGIRVVSGAPAVSGCTLENNGSFDVELAGSPSVGGSFDGCTLSSVEYEGTATQPIAWTANTFVDYGDRTSILDPDDLGAFATGNTFVPVGGAVTDVLTGIVTVDATWTAQLSPYLMRGTLTIQGPSATLATLTIEPGVEVRMATNSFVYVGGTSASFPGALVADGDAAGGPATIRFTADSVTPAPGFWRGVQLRGGADASTLLRNVEIRYAGAFTSPALQVQTGAAISIPIEDVRIHDAAEAGIRVVSGAPAVSGCTLENNGSFDVELAGSPSVGGSFDGCTLSSVEYEGTATQPIAWTANTFVDYGDRTSILDPDDLGAFATGNTFVPIGGAVTDVLTGIVTVDATWTAQLSPYLMRGTLTIQGPSATLATLTIEPGVEVRMASNSFVYVGGTSASFPGALVADGDAAGGPATIRFTADSVTPAPGFWRGVQLRGGADASTLLRNVEIRYAGAFTSPALQVQTGAAISIPIEDVRIHDAAEAGIRVVSGAPAVSGCTLENNGSFDVELAGSPSVGGSFDGCTLSSVEYEGTATQPIAWTGNTFEDWGQRTSKLRILELDEFTRANTFNPVTGAVLEVFSGTVEVDATWGPAAGPLVFDGNTSIDGTDGIDGVTTLTLEPGVTVRLPATRSFTVGRANGDPGELIADGAPGGLFQDTINFNVDSDVPNAGDWQGLIVDDTGRAVLREVQVRYADIAIRVDGTLGVSSNVTVNRSNVGLVLDQATLEGVLRGWSFRNCGTGVRATSTDVTFREANLLGGTFGAENLTPASHCIDAEMNFWGADDGPSGAAPAVGCETATPTGTGAPITEGVLFSTFLDVTPDDGDALACDDGDGFRDPCTGGNTVDCDDNCCEVANDSQSDLDGDGVGDACDANPVLRVSSDPADNADFAIVQDAADVSIQSGTRVEILPGLGPYLESVRLDRSQVYTFTGVTNANQDPIVIDGGSGPAFRVINKVGSVPMAFRDLTLRGGQGIRASVDTEVVDVVFDGIPGEALQLDAGVHTAERVSIGPFVGAGARVEQGASLDARRVDVRGATDAGFDADGALVLENVLIAAGADGVRLRANGSLEATYVTIADNTGVGVDAGAGGSVASIDRSIVYGNALDDLVAVGCGVLTWSDTGSPDCSAGGDNLSVDPLLDPDYRPQDGSACLDHGPDPSSFDGTPATDLAGGVRIADHDGDGLAVNDCGAYETVDDTLVPGDVTGLTWDFDFRLLWNAEPDAVEYHVYRDLLSNLGYASFGACRDDLDVDRTDTQLDDLETPAAGDGFFYLITAESIGGDEGTLGFASTAERSNFNACP